MKKLFKTSLLVGFYLLLSACGETSQPAPTLAPTTDPSIEYWIQTSLASTPTATATPKSVATVTPRPSPTQEYVRPTLIPTIDPTRVPELLSNAFSIQSMEGVNGHKIRQITGWEYGFGTIVPPYYYCPSYAWLDTNHILLYPVTGERDDFIDGGPRLINVVFQPVVTNLDSGASWLPPVNISPLDVCNRVHWSPKLGVLISSQFQGDVSTISTYTYDGRKLSSYTGQMSDISPSGTKLILDENILIDLRTNKKIMLNWNLEDYNGPQFLNYYWTYPDETRIYHCCYFYADLKTGVSHRFERSDFHDSNGNHLDPIGLWFHQGQWVRNNKYFLVHWLAVDDGPVSYQPLFDPATKLFYDLWELAGVSPDLTWRFNDVSPDRNHIWIVGSEGSYLVNLATFKSQYFPYKDPYTDTEGDWSADSKFVWFETHVYSGDESAEFQILSISDGKLSPIPVTPLPAPNHWWHPTQASVVYPAADKDALIFLNASTMLYQELPFALKEQAYTYWDNVWSPDGEKLALVAEDGSLWQVDYPKLENLEQLAQPLPDLRDIKWSPDGNFLSFVSGSDIYIVDTIK